MEDASSTTQQQGPTPQKDDYLKSGFARHIEKDRMIETFQRLVWPALARAGWTTQESKEGKTVFLPGGVDLESGKAGVDYYDRIKDVLDRLKERRTEEESKISDTFRREMSRPVKPPPSQPAPTRRRRQRATPRSRRSPEKPSLDMQWKEGGKDYPKRSSNVGPKYQVSVIPTVGTFEDPTNEKSDFYCDLIWDPSEAKEKGIDLEKDSVLDEVKHNVKEAALALLRTKKYNLDEFKAALQDIKPTDGSDWDDSQRKTFAAEIFRTRKDLDAVAEKMNLPIKTCLAYYFGTFKASDDYRLLKTVCCEERVGRLEALDHGVDACTICGDGGNLLICDGCEREYHASCLRPPLASIPEGDWECDECVDNKFLEARDYLLRHTKLFLREEMSRKRKREDGSEEQDKVSMDEESDKGSLRPPEAVLEAARMFAKIGSASLSKPLARAAAATETNESSKTATGRSATPPKPSAPAAEASPMEIDSPAPAETIATPAAASTPPTNASSMQVDPLQQPSGASQEPSKT